MGLPLVSLTDKIIRLNQRQIAILRDFEYRQKFFFLHKQEVDALVNATEHIIHKPSKDIYRTLQAQVVALQSRITTSLRYLSKEELERDETDLLSEERQADTNALIMLEAEYTELWQNLKLLQEGEVKSSLMLYMIDLKKEKDDAKKEQSINEELQKILSNLEKIIEEEKKLLESELNNLQQVFNFSIEQLNETKKVELNSAAEFLVHATASLQNLLEKENGQFIQPFRAFTSQKYALNQRILSKASKKVITLGMIKHDLAQLNPKQTEQYIEQLLEHYQQFEPAAVKYSLRFIRIMGKRTREKEGREEANLREEIALLKTRAQYDSLGMYNRKFGDELINKRIKLALIKGGNIALLLIDADKFKEVNDNYGHHVGDIVLTTISEITQRAIEEEDTFFRWGGEEFIVLFAYGTTQARAQEFAERVRVDIEREARKKVLNSTDPLLVKLKEDLKNHVRNITISGGGSIANISLNSNPIINTDLISGLKTKLISLADEGLYEAKREGRNKIILKTLEFN